MPLSIQYLKIPLKFERNNSRHYIHVKLLFSFYGDAYMPLIGMLTDMHMCTCTC